MVTSWKGFQHALASQRSVLTLYLGGVWEYGLAWSGRSMVDMALLPVDQAFMDFFLSFLLSLVLTSNLIRDATIIITSVFGSF